MIHPTKYQKLVLLKSGSVLQCEELCALELKCGELFNPLIRSAKYQKCTAKWTNARSEEEEVYGGAGKSKIVGGTRSNVTR